MSLFPQNLISKDGQNWLELPSDINPKVVSKNPISVFISKKNLQYLFFINPVFSDLIPVYTSK